MMDHEGDDSGFNLYEHYGASMDDEEEVAAVDESAFPMHHGWDDHHAQASLAADGSGAGVYPDMADDNHGYNTPHTTMEDFDSTQYGHEFQQTQQHFEGDPQQAFHNFMDQSMTDDHQHDLNQQNEYDLNSMEIYHTPTIYPDLTQAQQNTSHYGNYSYRPIVFFIFVGWWWDLI
jgi:hypothetical protein